MGFCPGVPHIRRTEAQTKTDNPCVTLRGHVLGGWLVAGFIVEVGFDLMSATYF